MINADQKVERENLKTNGHAPHQSGVSYVNPGEDDEMEIYGYKFDLAYTTFTWIGIFITLGTLRLFFHWYPTFMLYSTHRRCHLSVADKLLVVENYQGHYKSYFVKCIKIISTDDYCSADFEMKRNKNGIPTGNNINLEILKNNTSKNMSIYLFNGSHKVIPSARVVWIKKLCYVWDDETQMFIKLTGLDKGVTAVNMYKCAGLSKEEQASRRIIYGYNEIIVPVQSVMALLILEIINPFYIFTLFTIIVWMCENYYYYTVAIVIMIIFGVSSSIVQTRRNQKSLHDTVAASDIVKVCRGSNIYEDVSSSDLVPGDVVVIPNHGCDMQCDAVLLNGKCIVNESMLTGESVPVTKTPISRESTVLYDSREHNNHTLFCGTKVIQTRIHADEIVKAVVIRTGYMTARGNLIRSILYPPPADFKFDRDTYRFMGILAIISAIGIVYTIVSKISRGIPASDIAIKALDIITIVIPPALPAAMTVGKLYAQNRLQASKIFCINTRVINVAGSLNCMCFDKTGTLTEDGLDMWGVLPVEKRVFEKPVNNVVELKLSPLLLGMVTCHSNTIIDEKLCGDPLDVKMFESTGWLINDEGNTSEFGIPVHSVMQPPGQMLREGKGTSLAIGIVHEYQFSSTLQRMSVITKMKGSEEFVVYCKGSPEMIESLSIPHTVPIDLQSTLQMYTEKGYRVIALGRKVLTEENCSKIQEMKRNNVEADLEFLGLIVLENRLKPQTTKIIHTLRNANMKVVMITGDNILTAVSVAKECGIISQSETIVDVTATKEDTEKLPELYFSVAGKATAKGILLNGMKKDYMGILDVETNGAQFEYKFSVTGKTWEILREFFPDVLPKIVAQGAVFARMSSDQKLQLIQELQSLGYFVAMCGDGANDCGALKAAHAGISLSEAESSVASPFTSREANISCVPTVIREGRAALSTAFGIFKFMIAYSLTEFWSSILLYSIDSNLTDFQFLFIDIFLIVNFAFFFGKTEAFPGVLFKDPPLTRLISVIPILSITLQMIITIAFQILSFYIVHLFDWFIPFDFVSVTSYACYENYSVFCVSMFQYISLAIIYSEGFPYRKPVYTNIYLMLSVIIMLLICVYITLYPAVWIQELLELKLTPGFEFRIIVLALGTTGFILGMILEDFIIKRLFLNNLRNKYFESKHKYSEIRNEIESDPNWPPICSQKPLVSPTPTSEVPPQVTAQIHKHISQEKDIKSLSLGIENEAFVDDFDHDTKL